MATNMKEQMMELENSVEEKANTALNQVQGAGRKSYYAYLGMWRMIYDSAANTVDRSKRLFDQAVERGESVEQTAVSEAKSMANQVEQRAGKMQKRVRRSFRRSERELENQVEAVLSRLDVPSRAHVNKLNANLDALNAKLNDLLVTGETAVVAPIVGYDTLTAKEVVAKLDKLTVAELVDVKQYEMAHEDRVTVLREVDRRIEAMPIARYDALTVDEIEPLLSTLDASQLETVAAYEAKHENRVTLLRAVESELENRS